jgi:predicted MPP superfamily phosphohydrolase
VAVVGGFVVSALLIAATLVHIYRGGTTANDHFVAVVVSATHLVYPTLWWGAVAAGVGPLRLVGLTLLTGGVGVYSLFWLMDRRREAGPWMPLALLSQPAHSFALWTGLLLTIWAPIIVVLRIIGATALHPLWPGWLLLVPLALALLGHWWTQTHRTRVLRHTVVVPGLPRPIRLVQLSDLHASPTMTGQDLAAIGSVVDSLDPDLVVITGDHVMPFSEAEHSWLLAFLDALPGHIFAIPGNHDLPVHQPLAAEFEERGVAWLADRAVVVDCANTRVEIAGVDFHWADARGHLGRALDTIVKSEDAHLRLLLAHDPRLSSWVPPGRFDLVLCGHTHGGQVGGEMFGLRPTLLSLMGARDQGWFTDGATRTYVHRGNWHTGWPPRMGVAPEIALFELVGEAVGGD